MGENDTTHNQSRPLKIKFVTKIDNYFIICQYKIKETKKIQISTPISLEV